MFPCVPTPKTMDRCAQPTPPSVTAFEMLLAMRCALGAFGSSSCMVETHFPHSDAKCVSVNGGLCPWVALPPCERGTREDGSPRGGRVLSLRSMLNFLPTVCRLPTPTLCHHMVCVCSMLFWVGLAVGLFAIRRYQSSSSSSSLPSSSSPWSLLPIGRSCVCVSVCVFSRESTKRSFRPGSAVGKGFLFLPGAFRTRIGIGGRVAWMARRMEKCL